MTDNQKRYKEYKPIRICSNHCLNYDESNPHKQCDIGYSSYHAKIKGDCPSYCTWKSKETRDNVGVKYEWTNEK